MYLGLRMEFSSDGNHGLVLKCGMASREWSWAANAIVPGQMPGSG